MRTYPKAVIAEGVTDLDCGLAQPTYERTHVKKEKKHVDWWIYKGAKPYVMFKRC